MCRNQEWGFGNDDVLVIVPKSTGEVEYSDNRQRSECEMAERGPTSPDKPPFDKLIDRVPSDVRERGLGRQREGQDAVLNPTFIQLPSVLSSALYCGIEKLGECIGLSPQQVSDVISAADRDREGQIRYLLTTWAELRGEKATVEALMKGLYDADDTRTIDEVVEWMNTPGQAVCTVNA